MKRIIVTLTISLLLIVLFVASYFIYFCSMDYNGTKIVVPNPTIPLMVVILFVFGFVMGRRMFTKEKIICALILSSLLIVIFLLAINIIDNRYSNLLTHYYRQGYTTLESIGDYKNTKGNYIVINKKLNEYGYSGLATIDSGNDDARDMRYNGNYIQKVYLIDNEFYILFDWNKKEIIDTLTVDELASKVREETDLEFIDELMFYPGAIMVKSNGENKLLSREQIVDYRNMYKNEVGFTPVLHITTYRVYTSNIVYTQEKFPCDKSYWIAPIDSKISLTDERNW